MLSSSGDTSADGTPDLWGLDSRQRLTTWDGVATAGKVTHFASARTMGDARVPASQWKLNEGRGTTAGDLRGRQHGTLSANGATWADDTVAGTAAKVLALDGVSGTVTTAGTVVDTTCSFTVSTWAKSDQPGVLLGQDGLRASGFMIWHDQDGTWHFAMSKKDDDNRDCDQTLVTNDAARVQAGVWTQLTATFDEQTGLIALYVNGTLAGTGHHAKANAWKATGPLVLGRYKYQGLPTSHGKGRLSNLAVYPHSTVPTAVGTTLVSALSETKCADNAFGRDTDGNKIQLGTATSPTAASPRSSTSPPRVSSASPASAWTSWAPAPPTVRPSSCGPA